MKKILFSLGILTFLVGCSSKESQFKTAISDELKDSYACTHLQSPWISNGSIDPKVKTKLEQENFAIVIRANKKSTTNQIDESYNKYIQQLDFLTNHSLLTKKQETLNGFDGWTNKVDNSYTVTVLEYKLTDEGKKYIKTKNNILYISNDICYAKKSIDKVLNYTDQDGSAGQKLAMVKYSYEYTDIAPWAKEAQTIFPDIQKTLNNQDKTSQAILIKTNNGWQGHL